MTENQPKNNQSGVKEPYFVWTPDLICEFARYVAVNYKDSELWTSDLAAEKSLMKIFIKAKKVEKFKEGLIISETSNSLIVDTEKFNQLFNFLYNYEEPQI